MKSEQEIQEKLRERIHKARKSWFKKKENQGRTKDDLYMEFADRMRDPKIMLREYPVIVTLLWVLGEFDKIARNGKQT